MAWRILLVFLFLLTPLNLMVMSDDDFIPPSQMYLNKLFSYRLANYRDRGQVDFLLMGNSRTKPLNPATLEKYLGKQLHQSVTVHSLAVGGGYFPFYQLVFDALIADKPPKNLILAVSPRDFMRRHPRVNSIRNQLVGTSGYSLSQLPYAQPFGWLEAATADALATFFPILYYRNRGLSLLLPSKLHTWAKPKLGETQSALQKSTWKFLKNITPRDQIAPKNFSDYLDRASRFPESALVLYSGQLDRKAAPVDLWGGNLLLKIPGLERQEKLDRIQMAWDEKIQAKTAAYRQGKGCKDVELFSSSDDDTLPVRFLTTLQTLETNIYFLIVPAMNLEGCENSLAIHEQLVKNLEKLTERFSHVKKVINLNNFFQHSYMDLKHYNDVGEHLTAKAGQQVTIELGQKLVPFMTKH